MMDTIKETLRFKDRQSVEKWIRKGCDKLSVAIAVGEPFLEEKIEYAPWAITLTLPEEKKQPIFLRFGKVRSFKES
jgi:hypothetical protein